MNNGRDCVHGRQVGKCDSCDLANAEAQISRLEWERDYFAHQTALFCKSVMTEGLKPREAIAEIQAAAIEQFFLEVKNLVGLSARDICEAAEAYASDLRTNSRK
jgi:hypothetical protein